MKKLAFILTAFFAVLFFQFSAFAQAPRTLNAAEIQLALKKLGTLCSVLHIAAHPDDENTALLAYLANGRLCRTGYLSLTRGEGGQNLIGAEKGAALGVIRTQELLAARRIDGAEQFFTRAIDFGFSKTPEETLAKWNKQEVLSDVVWTIRKFRPDVIITRFPPDARAGHGHHQASAILAHEAFKLAGDKNAFPEQLKYVSVWQPKRLLWNAFVRGGEQPPTDALKIDVGEFNPLLGKSYTEIAAISRSQHKSQGFGSAERRGSRIEFLTHVAGEKAQKDLFDRIDTSFNVFADGDELHKLLNKADAEFNIEEPFKILPFLFKASEKLGEYDSYINRDLLKKRLDKSVEIKDTIRALIGVRVEATATQPTASFQDEITIYFKVYNSSKKTVSVSVAQNFDPLSKFVPTSVMPLPRDTFSVAPNQEVSRQYKYSAKSLNVTEPYWLQNLSLEKEAAVSYQNPRTGSAEGFPALEISGSVGDSTFQTYFTAPVQYRFVDRVQGEIYQPFVIEPPLIVNLTEPVILFASNQAKQMRLTVTNNTTALDGILKLELPNGWKAEPAQIPIKATDAETTAIFTLTPTENAQDGKAKAFVESGSYRFDKQRIAINYPHIPQQTLFPAAEANLVKLDIKTGRERIGYIMGSGDEIPESLRQIGYDVKLISDEELQTADLSKDFDTIIAGIRAYNTRQILRKTNQRILDFVKNGGTFLVQYNTNDDTLQKDFAPFPLKIGRERVTVEEAPVKFLAVAHPVLNFPNKITAQDFDGYVQERGIYFASEFAREFVPILEMHDPNEKEQTGSLLVANYGKGKFVYTGIAFFRQLPAGVPGAYRLFANLVSNQNKR